MTNKKFSNIYFCSCLYISSIIYAPQSPYHPYNNTLSPSPTKAPFTISIDSSQAPPLLQAAYPGSLFADNSKIMYLCTEFVQNLKQ